MQLLKCYTPPLTVTVIFILMTTENTSMLLTLYGVLGLAGITAVVVYVAIPLLFLWFPGIMRSFIFVPDGKIKGEEIPLFLDYDHPEKAGFVGARNFYITSSGGAKIGVWHTLPSSLENEASSLNSSDSDSVYREWLSNATVFLYLHGSAGTRTSSHRMRVYRLLNRLDYHVLALDYRGYGDSTGFANNETDLVEDAKTVYTWIRDRVVSGNIFVWGHSLGTGVASHLADLLANGGDPFSGIVLEAPFNNMADSVRVYHLSKYESFLPWYDYCFVEPLYHNDMAFTSDKHLSQITTPVLILHAKDDVVIPYQQALDLYKTVEAAREDPSSIRMISYDANLGYGHYNITLDPHLNTTVRQFVDKLLQQTH